MGSVSTWASKYASLTLLLCCFTALISSCHTYPHILAHTLTSPPSHSRTSHLHTHTPSYPHTLIPTHLSLECAGNSFLCPPLCGFSPLRRRLVSLLPRLVSLLPRLVSLLPLRGLMWWKSSSAELYATFSSRSTCRGTDQSNNQIINN